MIRRLAISLVVLAVSCAIGRYVPVDLIRHPPGTQMVSMPKDVDIVSCYTAVGAMDADRFPFNGKSNFGEFWKRRRGLHLYDGRDVGPRNAELESKWRSEHATMAGFLVYRIGRDTNAVVYCREGGWTSGAILGQMVTYSQDEAGQWVKVREDVQGSDSLGESIFRFLTVAASVLVGIVVVVVWNVRETKRRRQQHARQVSSEAAPSASPDEPSA